MILFRLNRGTGFSTRWSEFQDSYTRRYPSRDYFDDMNELFAEERMGTDSYANR